MLPEVGPQELDIAISDGQVIGLVRRGLDLAARHRIAADGLHVFPGGVDPHVHFGISLPRSSDYYTESCAAATGGITTVLTYDRGKELYSRTFPDWLSLAEQNFVIDYGFHLGLLTEGQLQELEHYVWDFGVTSFKFYMNYRGSEKSLFDSDTALDDGFLYRILLKMGSIDAPLRLCVHCENMEMSRALERDLGEEPLDGLVKWAQVRTGVGEAEAMSRTLTLAQAARASVYIVHLSSRESADLLSHWDLPSLGCFIETCPHYLCATAETSSPLAKVNPPVRFQADADALWGAISRGTIRTVGSDHVARTPDLKLGSGGFRAMKSGFPGVETTLPLLLTEGMQQRGISERNIAQLFSTNAAKIFGLYPRKGTLLPGSDADMVLVDLVSERSVAAAESPGRSGWSIYEGRSLRGWPVQTLVRGEVVFREGEFMKPAGFGHYLRRAAR